MALVSMSAFGEMHGASKQAVSKWKARGALKIVDGKIDVEASDRLMLHHGLGRFAEASTRPSTVNRQPSTQTPASTGLAQEISDMAADVGDPARRGRGRGGRMAGLHGQPPRRAADLPGRRPDGRRPRT